MNPIDNIFKQRDALANAYASKSDRTEKLRIILEKEHGRPFSYEEANKIARQLVGLYVALAGNRTVVRGGHKNKERLV